jgi:uncharacterized membrane protein YesL
MKRFFIFLAGIVLISLPLAAQTLKGDVAVAAVPVLAITLIIALAFIYLLRKVIRRKIRALRESMPGSPEAVSPIAVLELIQNLLGVIFPAVTAVLLALHLSGIIPYIGAAEEIAGILLSAGIAVCEILDGFLGRKKSESLV